MDTLVLSVQDLRRLVEEFGLADLMDRMIEALGTAIAGWASLGEENAVARPLRGRRAAPV